MKRKKRTPTELLRIRNKEIKALKEHIQALNISPSYTVSFLRQAIKEASDFRIGHTASIPIPCNYRPSFGRWIDAHVINARFILVTVDE